MKDLLSDFLKEGFAALEQAPFDFMTESPGSQSIDGLQAAVFLDWACARDLLDPSVKDQLAAINATWAERPRERGEAIRCLLGGCLRPEHFAPTGRAFANRYYRPGWRYNYLADLEELFPQTAELSHIDLSAKNAQRIVDTLDDRMGKFMRDANQ